MAIIKDKKYIINDKEILITSPMPEEAEEFIKYLEKVDMESEFLTREPGELNITIEKEREILKERRESDNSVFITVKVDGEIIGNLGFMGNAKKDISIKEDLVLQY